MVSIASLADAAQHQELFDYIERLKNDRNGWKSCIEKISNGCNAEEHFVLLQVIEAYLTSRYADDNEGQDFIRAWMHGWLSQLNSATDQPAYLANKVAQLFAMVFAADFPTRWPNFMEEVFFRQMAVANSSAVTIFFLRTLIAIDCEVVDREIPRTKQITERNTLIKDAMRDNCNSSLAVVWTHILAKSDDLNARELCLDVISSYVDWIDLELVVNDTTTPLIVDCLKNEQTCESAVSAVCAIVTKGMDAEKKLLLVTSLCNLLQENDAFTLRDNDVDDVLRTGPLVSAMGSALISCYMNFSKTNDTERTVQCEAILEKQAGIALMCLSNEDVDASDTVVEFLRRYVVVLKTMEAGKRHDYASRLISICVERYKAPHDMDLSKVDVEDVADFMEYRKQLRSIISAIGNFEPQTILMELDSSVRRICADWKLCDVCTIEATLALVYNLTEFTGSGGNIESISEHVKELVTQVLMSTITHCEIPHINSLFFEIACRYERILQNCPGPIPLILDAFLDRRGLRQESLQSRSRIVYLFCRFIKAHKILLGNEVENILVQLEPFLTETSETDYQLSREEQLYLYESTAVLIVNSPLPAERKQEFMKVLGLSLLQKFIRISERLSQTQNAEEAQQLHQRYADIIIYSARITKPFANHSSVQSCQCTVIFLELMKVFLERVTPNNAEELDALRQYLHRMVICLDVEILAMLPSICDKYLVAGSDLRVMHDFLILLQQIINKFKKRLLEIGLNIPALFDILWAAQTIPVDPFDEDSVRNMVYYNRAFLQTILSILSNDLIVLLTDCGPEFIHRVADSLVSFMSSNDVSAQRLTFQIINKMFVKVSNGGTNAFIEFLWEKSVCGAVEAPLSELHDPTDAQYALLQHEIYVCLQTLRSCASERFDQYLQSLLPLNFARQTCDCISSLKGKSLDKALDKLYAQLRLMRNNNVES